MGSLPLDMQDDLIGLDEDKGLQESLRASQLILAVRPDGSKPVRYDILRLP